MTTIVAFTAVSQLGLNSKTDARFGRAAVFIFVDADTGEVVNEIKNSQGEVVQGAGTVSAAMLAGQKVKAVASGNFGPKAYEALSKLNIDMWKVSESMTVQEAFVRYRTGQLEPMKVDVYK